jgi:hypothetical protein
MVIYLHKYRKMRTARIRAPEPARVELQCVNWIPVRGMGTAFPYCEPRQLSPDLPEEFAQVDIDEFVGRIYGLATQI